MGTALMLGIPAGVLIMVAVGAAEALIRGRRGKSGTPFTATYVDELTAVFYGTKRMELEHRKSTAMMRHEDAQGAPPRVGVDLDRGVVVVRRTES
jgi:hypothetical protein